MSFLSGWHLNLKKKKWSGGDIRSLTFRHIGSLRGGSWTVCVRRDKETGGPVLFYELQEHEDYGKMSSAVPESFMNELAELCNRNRVSSWDGFSGSNPRVRDGYGFSFRLEDINGNEVSASGTNRFPSTYRAFRDAFEERTKVYREALLRDAREQKRARGVSGRLTSALAVFRQKGTAGSGYRFVHLLMQNDGTVRVSWEAKNAYRTDEEPVPAGLNDVFPASEVPMDEIGSLILRHGLVSWCDHEGHTADPNNAEWFQIAFRFEKGDISAHGTLLPDGYEGFRSGFLDLLEPLVARLAEQKGSENNP
ncbi:MAG: hypothetical protein J5843_03060 [Clostridia bacterium]|nr:hypothetical protein [Clostridia bacterium]